MKPKHPTIAMSPPAKKSSQVVAMGHDPATNTLAIQFGSGTYHYHDVSAEKFAALQKADSIGAHLGKHIKPSHKFTRIE
jgi:hypothetical protein